VTFTDKAKGAAIIGAGMEVATNATGEPIIRLASAAHDVRHRIRERWNKQWEWESTSGPTKRLVQAPNRNTLRVYEGLSDPQCAILFQIRKMRLVLWYETGADQETRRTIGVNPEVSIRRSMFPSQ
jgi:hypothetical protein